MRYITLHTYMYGLPVCPLVGGTALQTHRLLYAFTLAMNIVHVYVHTYKQYLRICVCVCLCVRLPARRRKQLRQYEHSKCEDVHRWTYI